MGLSYVWNNLSPEMQLECAKLRLSGDQQRLIQLVFQICSKGRDKTCWASNRSLAELLCIHPDSVKRAIRVLCDLGVLTVRKRSVDGSESRLLTTKWDTPNLVDKCTRGGPNGPGEGGPNGPPNVLSKDNTKKKKGTTASRVPAEPRESGLPLKGISPKKKAASNHSNGFIEGIGKERIKNTPTTLKYAERLHRTIVEVFKVKRQWRREKWGHEFLILMREHSIDESNLGSILQFYLRNCEECETRENKLPRILSAKAFRHRFDWIERVYKREQGKNPQRNGCHDANGHIEEELTPQPREYRVTLIDDEGNEVPLAEESWKQEARHYGRVRATLDETPMTQEEIDAMLDAADGPRR